MNQTRRPMPWLLSLAAQTLALGVVSPLIANAQTTPAALLKGTNGCYALKLPGSMVDSNACESALFVVGHMNCTEKKITQTERIQAKLSDCRESSATAELKIGVDQYKIQLVKRADSQHDVWDINRPKRPSSKVASLSRSTRPAPATLAPAAAAKEPSSRVTINAFFDGASQIAITSNYGGDPSTNTAQRTMDRTRVGFDSAHLRASMAKNDWLFLLDLSAGDLIPIWTTSLAGAANSSQVTLTQAFAERKIDDKTFAKIGLIDHPLSTADKVRFFSSQVSYSFTELYATPHILSGITADRDLTERLRAQVFLGSGWNRTGALEDSWSTGGLITTERDALKASFGILTGAEPGSATDAKVTSFVISTSLARETSTFFATASMGSVSQKSAGVSSDSSWLGVTVSQTKKVDDLRSWGWRGEYFQNTDGLIIGRPGWDKVIAGGANYMWLIDEDVKVGTEAMVELGTSSRLNIKLGALLSWKI